ncbi:E3 ubiquitin-protein ligase [Golovinomyces cichoracearum]|uniref:E3 ubiquitin-protein ligase n=1 Tax=Golovinomyces cichoracearum TaxID=62708 RepID=A0A420IY60_9PEZI|nr:E3 ubiquitin-protein ligase [Golovinomyces cichoracearum]
MGILTAAQSIFLSLGLLQSQNHDHNCPRINSPTPEDEREPSASSSSKECPMKIISTPEAPLHEEAQISIISDEDSDLKNLNDSLKTLAAIFPDVQVEVFREMLSTFDKESRLAVVTDSLLRHESKWVKFRYKTRNKKVLPEVKDDKTLPDHVGQFPVYEEFRSTSYKKAVKKIFIQEFKSLSRSTINTVLADFNHSYTLARPTLIALSSKSWRFSLSTLFKRKKNMNFLDLGYHPLVIWQSNSHETLVPTLRSSGCQELDQEISESFIIPLQRFAIHQQKEKDYQIALHLNYVEAEQNESLHDCECCYTATSFEELTACDGGHFICFRCVRKSLNEAVFGHGWQRSIDIERGTLRCVAAISDDCSSVIPIYLIQRALRKDKNGKNLSQKLDERLAEANMLKSQLPLIRCPFCNYAEINEPFNPKSKTSFKPRIVSPVSFNSYLIALAGVGMIPLFLVYILISIFLFFSRFSLNNFLIGQLHSSANRIRRNRLGLKFYCQNKLCKRSSCRYCLKEWSDIHVCHESSMQDLRTQVELAMSLAIKRTCPRCNMSFVKSSGCNKLTCVCGYQMCYICRKNIGIGEGYRHFCEHFRPNGGKSCTECTKCDLYRCEDDEIVLRKAKQEAEQLWMKREESLLSCDENFRKVLEARLKKESETFLPESRQWSWKIPTKELIIDALVERLISV